MKKTFLFTLQIISLSSILLNAQSGITGTVIDGDFNESLPFANIQVKETGEGITSDFDGKYFFELNEGTYTLIFSFVGYETKEIQILL